MAKVIDIYKEAYTKHPNDVYKYLIEKLSGKTICLCSPYRWELLCDLKESDNEETQSLFENLFYSGIISIEKNDFSSDNDICVINTGITGRLELHTYTSMNTKDEALDVVLVIDGMEFDIGLSALDAKIIS